MSSVTEFRIISIVMQNIRIFSSWSALATVSNEIIVLPAANSFSRFSCTNNWFAFALSSQPIAYFDILPT